MIKNLKKSNEKVEIQTDMPISLANAIRRSANEIPILATDSLEISKNDSALYDEIIAHRMGLVPLKNENLNLPKDCDCKGKGCGKCTVKFKLKAKGPATVYSSELTPKTNVIYKMPLTILDKDQELEFVAIAKVGIGIEHSKFSPGMIYYNYIGEEASPSNIKEDDENFKRILEESENKENKELKLIIESWGQIDAKEIFIKSIETLNKNLKELSKCIK